MKKLTKEDLLNRLAIGFDVLLTNHCDTTDMPIGLLMPKARPGTKTLDNVCITIDNLAELHPRLPEIFVYATNSRSDRNMDMRRMVGSQSYRTIRRMLNYLDDTLVHLPPEAFVLDAADCPHEGSCVNKFIAFKHDTASRKASLVFEGYRMFTDKSQVTLPVEEYLKTRELDKDWLDLNMGGWLERYHIATTLGLANVETAVHLFMPYIKEQRQRDHQSSSAIETTMALPATLYNDGETDMMQA